MDQQRREYVSTDPNFGKAEREYVSQDPAFKPPASVPTPGDDLLDVGKGFVKGIGRAGLDMGRAIMGAQNPNAMQALTSGELSGTPSRLQSRNTPQAIGGFGADVASFAVPGGTAARGSGIARGVRNLGGMIAHAGERRLPQARIVRRPVNVPGTPGRPASSILGPDGRPLREAVEATPATTRMEAEMVTDAPEVRMTAADRMFAAVNAASGRPVAVAANLSGTRPAGRLMRATGNAITRGADTAATTIGGGAGLGVRLALAALFGGEPD